MDCPLRSGSDLAERYVAGTLSEAEQSAFEAHYFTCTACLAEVQLLQDVRDGLTPKPGHAAGPGPGVIAGDGGAGGAFEACGGSAGSSPVIHQASPITIAAAAARPTSGPMRHAGVRGA